MSISPPTSVSISGCSAALDRLRQALREADAVVVGAGAGLSAAAGLTCSGERFQRHFADFIAQYGLTDMYSAGFYPFPSPEAYWAYWSRHIWFNRYTPLPGTAYATLLGLLRGRDYFVLTTNVDHAFQRAGFDKQRLFYTQGDYGLFQCAQPCHDKTYDNQAAVARMVAEQRELRIPRALVPRCPVCGGPMAVNLRCDDRFVEDEGWQAARRRYEAFLGHCQGRRVLYWELGVGWNTPGIIKLPFWQQTYANPQALYAVVNVEDADAPPEIAGRALCIQGDIAPALAALARG